MIDMRKAKRTILSLKMTTLCLIAVIGGLMALTTAVWLSGERKVARTIDTLAYLNDRVSEDSVITQGEKSLKLKKMWVKIIAVHGVANFERAMGKQRLAEFINRGVRWSILLGLPDFYLPASNVMESGFDSRCVGGIGEVGQWQHHSSALPMMNFYLRQMWVVAPEIARELDPQVWRVQDLTDEIKSMQVQCILAWGLRREFPDELYWISAVHWGSHRVRPWYDARTEPKDYFIFYSKDRLDKIDKRSPLMYYFYCKRIMSNFERYNVDLGTTWVSDFRSYRDDCQKNEREYIDSRQLVAKLLRQSAVLELKGQELKDGLKDIAEYRTRIRGMECELDKIYGEGKARGDYESLYTRTKAYLREAFGKK